MTSRFALAFCTAAAMLAGCSLSSPPGAHDATPTTVAGALKRPLPLLTKRVSPAVRRPVLSAMADWSNSLAQWCSGLSEKRCDHCSINSPSNRVSIEKWIFFCNSLAHRLGGVARHLRRRCPFVRLASQTVREILDFSASRPQNAYRALINVR